jgi:hypothetical protein
MARVEREMLSMRASAKEDRVGSSKKMFSRGHVGDNELPLACFN